MRKNISQLHLSSGGNHSLNSISHVNESSLAQVSSGSRDIIDNNRERKSKSNYICRKFRSLLHFLTFPLRLKKNTSMWNKLSNRNKMVEAHQSYTQEDQRQEESIQAENPTLTINCIQDQTAKLNFLELIQYEILPKDIFPEILLFAGPQTTRSLSLTCKLWRKRVLEESVWKVLCQEMNKVGGL